MRNMSIIGSLFSLVAGSLLHAQEKEPQNAAEKFELRFAPAKVAQGDSAMLKLQKELFNTAVEMAQLHLLRIESGRESVAGIGLTLERVIQSGIAIDATSKERQELLAETVRFAKHVEDVVQRQHDAGFLSKSDIALARYVRLNAEIRLLKEKESEKK